GADWDGPAPTDGRVPAETWLEQNGLTDEIPPRDDIGPDGDMQGYAEEDIQSAIDRLSQRLKTVNSGNEMLMIELQPGMQQRSELLNMGTNILKQLSDTNKAILNNLG